MKLPFNFARGAGMRFALAALAIAAMASACSQPPSAALQPVKTDAKALGQRVDKLMAEDFKLKPDAKLGQPDITGLAAALPKSLKLSWDKLEFDAASGASILHGVKLTPADNSAVGVSIDELKIWGLDAGLAKARLSGQRLAESGSLARRVDAKTVQVFGLETLMKGVMKASTGAAIAAAGALAPDGVKASLDSDLDLTNYRFSVARIVLDDIRLRPWELQVKELKDETWKDVLPVAQTAAAATRSLAIDTAAWSEGKAEIAYRDRGADSSMALAFAKFASRGMRGGDTDFSVLDGMKMNFEIPVPPLGADASTRPVPMKLTAAIDHYTIENVRLEKALGYLARGVVPPRTETNLMSLGVYRFTGERYGLGGNDVYTVGSGVMDLSGFYWFIPSHIRVETKDIAYNVAGLVNWIGEMMKTENPNSVGIDPKIIDALKKHKLDKPTFDTLVGFDWNAATGAAHFDAGFGLHDYFTLEAKADLGLPNFKSVSDLVPGGLDTAKQDEIGKLFKTVSSLKSAELNLRDQGGLTEGFALAVDLAAIAPPDTPGMGFIAGKTPASLRQLAYSSLYTIGDTATKDEPKLRELIRASAAFLEKGGALHLAMKPDKPVALSKLDDPSLTPTQAFDLLKLSLVNEAPPGAKKN